MIQVLGDRRGGEVVKLLSLSCNRPDDPQQIGKFERKREKHFPSPNSLIIYYEVAYLKVKSKPGKTVTTEIKSILDNSAT